MLFNSFEFLFFFPLILLGFYLVPHRMRWIWLLLGSYYFYMAAEPSLVLLLLLSTVVDYFCGLGMWKAGQQLKKLYLATSISVNIGILFVFKYLGFFTASFQGVLGFFGLPESDPDSAYQFEQILLPVGISFYTFQTLGYSIEVYRGNIKPERHFGTFALYVAFFPQLVAGPIERANRLLPQLKKRIHLDLGNIRKGLIFMAWGFFLKIVVADRLGLYVDEAYSDPELYHGLPLALSAIFFGFQIYYDFSAYTAIAIGAAKTMGYDLMQNFNRPFFATSAMQFWNRWHISLTRWMLDYLYRPLKVTLKMSRLLAVFLVFFVIGLWHGANWTFVVWGMLNGLLLILEVATNGFRKKIIAKLGLSKKVVGVLGWIIVMGYLVISLIFFRSPSIEAAWYYLEHMFTITNLHVNILNNYFELFLSFLLILGVQAVHYTKGNHRIDELVVHKSTPLRWTIYITYILIIVFFALNRQQTFIYFQF